MRLILIEENTYLIILHIMKLMILEPPGEECPTRENGMGWTWQYRQDRTDFIVYVKLKVRKFQKPGVLLFSIQR